MITNSKSIYALIAILLASLSFPSIALSQGGGSSPQSYFWISTREDVFVKPSLDNFGPSVALLRFGDIVQVSRCIPSCDDRSAWVELVPFGATRLSYLSPFSTRTREAHFIANGPQNFIWAKYTGRHALDIGSEQMLRHGDELYFIDRTPTALVRPNGTEVPLNLLDVFEPSTFSGWNNPPAGGFVFIIRDTQLTDSLRGTQRMVHRYDRFPVDFYTRSRGAITVPTGYIEDRNAVRLGYARQRPTEVPRGSQWVHVDLDQQVLTAYDRNDHLAYATLISSGSARHPTRSGIFQVRRKITYTQMVGGGSHPYSVEGVPWVMYFNEAIALHGAFYHDSFGSRRSHGCVNLSIRDAEWLWRWSEIEIPPGWRSIHPIVAPNTNDLWVVVE